MPPKKKSPKKKGKKSGDKKKKDGEKSEWNDDALYKWDENGWFFTIVKYYAFFLTFWFVLFKHFYENRVNYDELNDDMDMSVNEWLGNIDTNDLAGTVKSGKDSLSDIMGVKTAEEKDVEKPNKEEKING